MQYRLRDLIAITAAVVCYTLVVRGQGVEDLGVLGREPGSAALAWVTWLAVLAAVVGLAAREDARWGKRLLSFTPPISLWRHLAIGVVAIAFSWADLKRYASEPTAPLASYLFWLLLPHWWFNRQYQTDLREKGYRVRGRFAPWTARLELTNSDRGYVLTPMTRWTENSPNRPATLWPPKVPPENVEAVRKILAEKQGPEKPTTDERG